MSVGLALKVRLPELESFIERTMKAAADRVLGTVLTSLRRHGETMAELIEMIREIKAEQVKQGVALAETGAAVADIAADIDELVAKAAGNPADSAEAQEAVAQSQEVTNRLTVLASSLKDLGARYKREGETPVEAPPAEGDDTPAPPAEQTVVEEP